MIKTPDHRVRVFISSTLNELAEERMSVKQAVEKLRLIPVLFETSARFHPPKELYRAYLEQSDIFIGIYWNSYGWVAPEMSISGLEDEYNLSDGKSKLIYVKDSVSREKKLDSFLLKIEGRNAVCYKPFKDANDLKELAENDLAILLSEHYQSQAEEAQAVQAFIQIPLGRSLLIGREKELEVIAKLITGATCKLISIIGAGGTGKTSLAIELAGGLKNDFKHGVVFFALASITEIDHISSFIASKFKLQENGDVSIREILISWLGDKQLLLVLDNLEQIIEIRDLISEILRRCDGVRMLCTSRTPLHIMQEHIYPLDPLPKPGAANTNLMENAAIQLFVARAGQVNPMLQMDEKNLFAIRDICNQVDGIPLAIELAAMRTRFLPPSLLIENFHRALDLSSKGPSDLPVRQQALANTIAWSYRLLDDVHQLCFRLFAIFNDGWTMEAAGSLTRFYQVIEDAESVIERLLDVGLVQLTISDQSVRYNFYVPIREYAMDQLIQHSQLERAKKWHSDYYIQLALQFEFQMGGTIYASYHNLIEREYENLRAAYDYLIEKNELEKAWMVLSSCSDFWSAEGKFMDALQWMDKAGVKIAFPVEELSAVQKNLFALALQLKGTILFFKGDYQRSFDNCLAASTLFEETGNKVRQSWSLAFLGLANLSLGKPDAGGFFERSISFSTGIDEKYGLIISNAFYAEVFVSEGKLDMAFEYVRKAEAIAKNGHESYLCLVYISFGNFYLASQNIPKAIESYRQSLDWFEQSSFKTASGWALISLVNCYFINGDIPASAHYSKLTLEYARNMGHSILLLEAMMAIGLLLTIEGKEEEAVRLYLGAKYLHGCIKARLWSSTVIWMAHFQNYMQPFIEKPEFAHLNESAFNTTVDELIALANRL